MRVDAQAILQQSIDQSALRSVDRAVSDLRRGEPVLIEGQGGVLGLAQAIEAVTSESLARLRHLTGETPRLVLTARRAAVLGLSPSKGDHGAAVAVSLPAGAAVEMARDLADPTRRGQCMPSPDAVVETQGSGTAAAVSVLLAKIARLLPAVAFATPRLPDAATDVAAWCLERDLLRVRIEDVIDYQRHAARMLRRVAEARVPLEGAENTRIVAFRPEDGGVEHLAIVIGDPDPAQPVLARLHSECFTGDLLGSLRCDCGDQLRGAIAEVARNGGGVIVYLAQEGRGIGLVNKLRAYRLQDTGLDTVDANEILGYDADERIYLPAAEILRQLGFERVRLMTNNPEKLRQLARCGIEVVERRPHIFPANGHNEGYLRTKAERSGHLL